MVNKRGRKRTTEPYFGPTEEAAVVKFLESDNQMERDEIFNTSLKAPLDKMVESIIRKYKLYRKGEIYEDVHTDTMSFLITKIHKFEPGLGKKAYSYFGTICKHYALGMMIKDDKHMRLNMYYDDVSSTIENDDKLTYTIEGDDFDMTEFISKITSGIKEELNDENLPIKKKLSDNERKVGYALIEILENWETAFEGMDGGSKYNKNQVLETMRNYTNLSTKDIRLSMKRFKDLYLLLQQHGL